MDGQSKERKGTFQKLGHSQYPAFTHLSVPRTCFKGSLAIQTLPPNFFGQKSELVPFFCKSSILLFYSTVRY